MVTEENLIENKELINKRIRAWNNAGVDFNAEMLGLVFKKLESSSDVSLHNFIMFHVNKRLGEQGEEFKIGVAKLIETLSLRNLTHGKEKQRTTPK